MIDHKLSAIATNAIVGVIPGGITMFITGELFVGLIVAVVFTQYLMWFDPYKWLKTRFEYQIC